MSTRPSDRVASPLVRGLFIDGAELPAGSRATIPVISSGDKAMLKQLQDDCVWPGDEFSPAAGLENWHIDKVTALKTRIHHAGYIKAGPVLPPYHVAPAERFETAKILAAKDREIQKKYPHKTMLEAAAVPAE